METAMTMVRLYIPEMTHSMRKARLDEILHLLHGQRHVHGIMVVPCVRDGGAEQDLHYATVGDVLRRHPDPPLIVEFLDETVGAAEVRRLLRNLEPASNIAYWDVHWEKGTAKHSAIGATTARA
jgi:hypothetical protein